MKVKSTSSHEFHQSTTYPQHT